LGPIGMPTPSRRLEIGLSSGTIRGGRPGWWRPAVRGSAVVCVIGHILSGSGVNQLNPRNRPM